MILNKKIELIKGEYTISEIKPILLKMLNDKIGVHEVRIFSHKIKYETVNLASKSRIAELENSKIELIDFFNSVNFLNKTVKVSSVINIEIESDKE